MVDEDSDQEDINDEFSKVEGYEHNQPFEYADKEDLVDSVINCSHRDGLK